MNIFQYKVIALVTMIIDHMAFLNISFLKNNVILRYIGRISFPLYIFILSESLIYTKNRKKFLANLFIIALLSEIPFQIYFKFNFSVHNVIFTMFFGSLIVCLIDKSLENKKYVIPLVISMILPAIFNSDYGVFGAYSIVFLYYIKTKISRKNIYSSMYIIFMCIVLYNFSIYFLMGSISAILILFYNKEKGYAFKRFFHLTYPLHLIILYLINLVVS